MSAHQSASRRSRAIQDVAGDVGGAAAGGKGVRPQPHQGLSRLDLKLGHQHPGGLTHLGPRQRVQLGPGIAVGVSNRGL
jgi:hypothetical protein